MSPGRRDSSDYAPLKVDELERARARRRLEAFVARLEADPSVLPLDLDAAYPGRPYTAAELAERRATAGGEDRSRRRWVTGTVVVWAAVVYLGLGGPAWP